MVIDHTHHKRPRPSHSDEKTTKRFKVTDERMSMDALAFQTPHPNHEVQSVAYQLPSSSPQPSPGPVSPVSPVPVSKKKERSKHTRSRTGPNATSTPVERRTDITPPSFTLSSTDYRRALHEDDSSRPASRSSRSSKSTTSSRASNRERGPRKPPHYQRQTPSQLKHTKSLSALDGDDVVPFANTDGGKKYGRGHGSKSKSGKRFTLDSPYMSRASSPVRLEKAKKAHIPTPEVASKPKRRKKSHILGPPLALPGSGNSPLGLTDTCFNANLPPVTQQNRDQKQQYRTQTHDKTAETHRANMTNKSKSMSKRKSAKGAENRLPVAGRDKSSNLERRPSAPSGLTLPRSQRPPLQPSRLRSMDNDHAGRVVHLHTHPNETTFLMEDVRRIAANPATARHPPAGLRPAASMQQLHREGHVNPVHETHGSNRRGYATVPGRNDAHTAWMNSRTGVDFNRPPSQLDVNIGINQGDDDDDRYCSYSSSEEDDYLITSEKSRYSFGQNFGFGLNDNLDLDLDLEVVAPFLYANGRTLDQLAPSLPSHDLVLDEDAFAKDIRVISTPSNLPGGKSLIEGRNNRKAYQHSELRRTASFPSLSLHKLSESPPCEEGLSCSDSEHPRRQRPEQDSALDIVHRPPKNEKEEERVADPDGELDMELTQGVNPQCLHLDNSHAQSSNPELSPTAGQVEEAISWVSDSIISPPTAYVRWKGQNVESMGMSKGDDRGSHSNVLDEESHSSTPSDSIITSLSHESLRIPYHNVTNERHTAENEGGEHEEPTVIGRTTTKRTRSGTIMPANPGAPSVSGARRTRSGTIIGPIVASAAATAAENGSRLVGGISSLISTVVGVGKTRQTRSGTIIASASSNAMPTTVTESGIGMSISSGGRQQNRSRSGSMLHIVPKAISQPMSISDNSVQVDEGRPAVANALLDPEAVAAVQEVGGFVDSVYFPSSSVDELDIIFAPTPEEEEGLYDIAEEWRVAVEPPSPEAAKKRGKGSNSGGGGHAILGLAARAANAGRWLKSKSGMLEGGRSGKGLKARFEPGVGGSGPEDALEDEPDALGGTAGVVEPSSDDELLLVPGATAFLFR